MATTAEREPVCAPEAEAPDIQKLAAVLTQQASAGTAQLIGPNGETLSLPHSVFTLLTRLVQELARGHAVTILPIEAELTTQQAADLLNISRPYLVRLLERQELPYHMVGTHRRIRFQDLMAYRQRRSAQRRTFFARMAAEAQDMGMYE